MDRRRFIPGPESMEGRMMLSTATAAAPTPAATNTAAAAAEAQSTSTLPYTIRQKLERIDRLPINLRATSPNRPLPQELITPIQDAMRASVSSMGSASPTAINMFNSVLRDVVSRPSLRAQDARALTNALTQVLVSAGATTTNIDTISDNLNLLATQVNTTQSQPIFLTSNDYATVLQMTLIVGRPMPAPNPPAIAAASGTQADPTHNLSRTDQPTFVGTYEAQANLQIFDADTEEVYGQAASESNGRYTIPFNQSLAPGTYRLRIRAVDELGHVGKSSQLFFLKVAPPASR